MKTYLIYHVPGEKIGCTDDLYRRMRQQGFTRWEILEEYNCIYEASERELQLQAEYGYKIDKCPYWQSVENFSHTSTEARSRGGITQGNRNALNGHMDRMKTPESLSLGGKVAARLKRHLTFEDAECIRAKYKQLDLKTAQAKRLVLVNEYNVSDYVIQGIIYNRNYTEE